MRAWAGAMSRRVRVYKRVAKCFMWFRFPYRVGTANPVGSVQSVGKIGGLLQLFFNLLALNPLGILGMLGKRRSVCV
jgi:hypothetical protein